MDSSQASHRIDVDPRILKVQVERAANTLRDALIASPVWACIAALACSELFQPLGAIPFLCGGGLILLICMAVIAIRGVLAWLERERRAGTDAKRDEGWLKRLLWLNVLLSGAWGLAPWLL